MDSCKNYLLISFLCKCTDFFQYTFNITAPHTASCIRDDAVGTKLITSVLNLYICSYMLRCMIDRKIFVFFCLIDLDHVRAVARFVLSIFCQCIHDISLLVVAKHKVDRLVFFQLFSACLHITACCHNNCIRVHFFCLVKHLS